MEPGKCRSLVEVGIVGRGILIKLSKEFSRIYGNILGLVVDIILSAQGVKFNGFGRCVPGGLFEVYGDVVNIVILDIQSLYILLGFLPYCF